MTTSPATAAGRTADLLGLAVFLALAFGVAWTASAFTLAEIPTWYAGLNKPAWTPPNWLFGPVWTVLYALMAVAAWRVWRSGPAARTALPLAVWGVQLALNFAWSLLFFGRHDIGWALADIAALWLAIAATIALFGRIDRPAAWMLVPYLVWVSYATALNAAILGMNA